MSDRIDIQVLVVGAGPTGLMLANQLARLGVRVAIVDRHAGPARESRALGVHARTLEIYSQLGLASRAIELGRPAVGVNLWTSNRRPAVRIPLGDIGRDLSPYPYVLILGQDDNERLLGDLLARQGVAVQWNTELVGLEQHADRVRAHLRRSDGSSAELDAGWVAGCDGAHSAVREANAIPFAGAPYEHVFFVADTRLTGPLVAGELNVVLRNEGFHLFFPMRGSDHWRVVGILPPQLRGRDGLDFEQVFPSVRGQTGLDLRLSACDWFSSYRIHHRRAARFRDRRCLLLGDAAHIHSPVGAQGMNTGLQDAYNLGWKLALVCAGRAGDALLDSYHDERWPVAGRLLRTTDRAFSLVISDSMGARLLRTRVLARLAALAMRFGRFRELAFRTVSQVGIAYRGSRLSATSAELPATAPRAGDRFPWLRLRYAGERRAVDPFERFDGRHFDLLLIGQPAPTDASAPDSDLLRLHRIPGDAANERELARAGIPVPSFWLLRPDGHVGLAGRRFDPALARSWFADRLGVVSP